VDEMMGSSQLPVASSQQPAASSQLSVADYFRRQL